MKITQALLAEHVVYHNLFDYVESATPRLKTLAEIRALARLLEAMLALHSEAEDTLLIEPLEPSFSQMGQEENFHAEHKEMDYHLAQARDARRLASAKRHLLRAVAVSRKHFDKEERIVFPMAERQLSARSLEELGKRWAKHRRMA